MANRTQACFYLEYLPVLTNVSNTNIVKNATSTTTEYSKIITLTNPSTIIEEGDFLIHPNITKLLYVTSINSSLEIDLPIEVYRECMKYYEDIYHYCYKEFPITKNLWGR